MSQPEFAPVAAVLNSALRGLGIDKDIARYEFVLHWSEIVGAEIAKRTSPQSFRNGILRVQVRDSTWAQELSFYKTVILKRLKKFVADDTLVKDVMFFVG